MNIRTVFRVDEKGYITISVLPFFSVILFALIVYFLLSYRHNTITDEKSKEFHKIEQQKIEEKQKKQSSKE